MVRPECSVQSPWFELIASGAKTVEGRLHKGAFAELGVVAVQLALVRTRGLHPAHRPGEYSAPPAARARHLPP